MTFQQIILALQSYWAERGCTIVQPWDVEKGAGTFNAATYLRALGPEPWNVAYVEPSRRPTDGRYGENPNRLERHHQFQVLLKPSPKDIQELYLGSLRAIGIDPLVHDIRFVEDNWESPTLGAWGLGWEVWYDGMEITQFTYFQQCGGYDLDPVAVELTYGLERIAMSLQDVENVYDMIWVGDLTYGDVRHAEEVQWSKHNFEAADVATHLRWFEEYKDERLRLCDAGLVIPAYDYAMRCSHVFNILDARGAIGVTERQAYILRVREISKRCADAWMALREELGHPLIKAPAIRPSVEVASVEAKTEGSGPFLFELGTEEIPARMAKRAADSLLKAIGDRLEEWGVAGTGGVAHCTPRRLVVAFDDVPLAQPDREETSKGPPTRIAFDADGNKTRAGEAFYAKLVDGDEVYKEGSPKGEYLMVKRSVKGRAVAELLADALPTILAKLHWPKPMRWGYEPQDFVRPVHWIACVLGGAVVPFAFAGVASDDKSRGHRFHAPDEFEVANLAQLRLQLRERSVLLSAQERREQIQTEAMRLAAEAGGTVEHDEELLEELMHISEWPVPLLGTFEPELLQLPREAIVTPMKTHQRYFPVVDPLGELLPCFVAVAGTDVTAPADVAHNYARVLRARLADARFFFETDKKTALEDRLPRLETQIWLKQLGSMRDKTDRIVALTTAMGGDDVAREAARLCKADLVSNMVVEFPKLQGIMGSHYASDGRVGLAIREHYSPKFAGDSLPTTEAGALVALADRFDSILGCFGIGLKPTGSKDPYALRRQAIAIIRILAERGGSITAWVDGALSAYGRDFDCKDAVLAFFDERTRYYYREQLPRDVVDAVCAAGTDEPAEVTRRIDALAQLRRDDALEPILTTFKRVANISKGVEAADLTLTEEASIALRDRFDEVRDLERSKALALLKPSVDRFFDDVLVMAEEPDVRAARLGLLARLRDHFSSFADFSRIQG